MLGFHICADEALQKLGNVLDVEGGGVDAKIVIVVLAPTVAGIILIVFCAALIHTLDFLDELFFGEVFVIFHLLQASVDLCGHFRIDKDAHGIHITKDVVRTASNDDAGGFFGKLAQNGCLCRVNFVVLMKKIAWYVAMELKRTSCCDREEQLRLLLDDLVYVFFCELRAVGNFGHNFLVVVGNAEVLRKTLADFTTAASKFAANGNDLIQVNPSLKSLGLSFCLYFNTKLCVCQQKTREKTLACHALFYQKDRERVLDKKDALCYNDWVVKRV